MCPKGNLRSSRVCLPLARDVLILGSVRVCDPTGVRGTLLVNINSKLLPIATRCERALQKNVDVKKSSHPLVPKSNANQLWESAWKWTMQPTHPITSFLAVHTVRDPWGRTSTLEFHQAFAAWYADWQGEPISLGDGKTGNATVQDGLSAHGIRKMKSNGNMTFAGIRWHDATAVQALLAKPPAKNGA